jgi:peroxiredoxin
MNAIREVTLKRFLILAVILASVPIHSAVKGMNWFQRYALIEAGQRAPVFQMQDADGRIYNMTGFMGKSLLMTFCALREPACASQARDLNRFAEQYGHLGLEILFIANSPTPDEMKKFDKEVDADFIILQDRGGKTQARYRAETVPTNFVIDKSGTIVYAHAGRIRPSSAKIRRIIETALGEGK